MLAVVAGHVFTNQIAFNVIYLWHMPLFFFLSGYLFSPKPIWSYARQKALHLLVPYAVFLVMLSSRELIALVKTGDMTHLLDMLMGGRALKGWWGTFWFVTVLYLTQQIANIMVGRLRQSFIACAMLALLIGAYLTPKEARVPWAADVALFAVPLFYGGHLYRKFQDRLPGTAVSVTLAAGGILLVALNVIEPFNMKLGVYGTPIVSLVACLCVIHALIASIRRFSITGWFWGLADRTGRASMTIMFLHPAVYIVLKDAMHLGSQAMQFALAVLIPMAAHDLLARWSLSRALFLGHGQHSQRAVGRSEAV